MKSYCEKSHGLSDQLAAAHHNNDLASRAISAPSHKLCFTLVDLAPCEGQYLRGWWSRPHSSQVTSHLL